MKLSETVMPQYPPSRDKGQPFLLGVNSQKSGSHGTFNYLRTILVWKKKVKKTYNFNHLTPWNTSKKFQAQLVLLPCQPRIAIWGADLSSQLSLCKRWENFAAIFSTLFFSLLIRRLQDKIPNFTEKTVNKLISWLSPDKNVFLSTQLWNWLRRFFCPSCLSNNHLRAAKDEKDEI